MAVPCCTGLLQVHARRRKLDPDVDLLQIAKDLPGLSGELLQPLPALHLSGRACAEPVALQHVTLQLHGPSLQVLSCSTWIALCSGPLCAAAVHSHCWHLVPVTTHKI